MKRRQRRIVPLGLAIALGVLALGACRGEPEPAGEGFDGALADSLVRRQVAFGPRVPGTEAHDGALAWMVEYLAARADTVETIPFTHVTADGDTLELANVFARFRPQEPARILLVAHWDTRPVAEMSPDSAARRQPVLGANDGASGVAVLLALADVFSRQPPPVGVDILLTDGEDWGHDPVTLATDTTDMFLGARHFARTRGATYRPLYGILLDIVGGQGARFLYEGHSLNNAPEVVGRVWRTAADLGYDDVFVQASGHYSNDDHVPLNQAGIRTIDIIDSGFISGPYWHTTEDTPDKISPETLDAVGEVVLEVIRREGSGD